MVKQAENLEQMLEERFQRWEDVFIHGANDPGYPDGVNLNLIRNHILYYKQKIQEAEPSIFGYPAIYYKETPPKVSDGYMAVAGSRTKKARNDWQR